ncbi:MAG: hypothetical protein ACRCX2_01780, partial [Paraclostridium sp.]
MFKVGDRVWCVDFGWGTVVAIKSLSYPVNVEFDDGQHQSFVEDGRHYQSGLRALFFEEIDIPKSALKRPRFRAKKDENYF